MYVNKNFTVRGVLAFSAGHIVWLTAWAAAAVCLYEFTEWDWLSIPWLPVSLIGTAVAFYVGFKNNQAYDRLWEARKIWGAIVNSSRAWGSGVKGYVSGLFAQQKVSDREIGEVHQRLIYRHIGWLYALRSQLLIPASWEHINQKGHIGKTAERRRETFGVGLLKDDSTEELLRRHLPEAEYEYLINRKNTATQIIDRQAQELRALREADLIDDFRHMELQKLLNDCYIHQGKCERIKNFPLPRQYANMSYVFVGIFIFLLPFGMMPEFAKIEALKDFGTWMSIPFTVLVGWVFLMMELVGDYSENPFEGLGNDIPMMAISRNIEIDLREMLGEAELPPPIEPKNGVLM